LSLSKHQFHPAARDWFAQQAGEASVLFCRSTQQSLLRLLTTEMVMRPYDLAPMSNAQAWQVYEGFLSDERIAVYLASSARRAQAQSNTSGVAVSAMPTALIARQTMTYQVRGARQYLPKARKPQNGTGRRMRTDPKPFL